MFGFVIVTMLIVIAMYLGNMLNVLSLLDLTEAVGLFREFIFTKVKIV